MANKHTELNTKITPTWCPGCGDFGIWTAFKNAALEEGWNNENTVLIAGIGCHGHIVNFTQITSFEGLHGRALPVAEGLKLANSGLNVFVFTGDGDCLSEGGNHFLHACRRNNNIKVILHDNAIYGLTTGQTSPRSPKGFVSKSTPQGSFEEPLNPLALAITAGASFVARGYAGDIDELTGLIKAAAKHKGFALLDVLQPCVTFNKAYSHYYYQKNIYRLDPSTHDVTNKMAALEKSMQWGEKNIPVGVLLQQNKDVYEDLVPQLKNKTLVRDSVALKDLTDLYAKFK
jgi:2-oxoglutarate ferredoxin oxidoreductase subunit beta